MMRSRRALNRLVVCMADNRLIVTPTQERRDSIAFLDRHGFDFVDDFGRRHEINLYRKLCR